MELAFLTIAEIARLRERGDITPAEPLAAVIQQVDRLQPFLNCYITLRSEEALEETRRLDRGHFTRGTPQTGRDVVSLAGLPLALKDNIATASVRTTAGSKILAGHLPAEDAPAWARLRRAGAILLGKTNMDEFAFVPTGLNPHYGAIRNPWDTARIAGGSSGGSAAAVAAGMAVAALGTDAGGSIRIPAAFCGVVGLKPTYGLVPLRGFVASGNPGIDHIGPIARSVADAAILLDHMAGEDPLDPTSNGRPPGKYGRAALRAAAAPTLAGVRIGVPTECYFDDVHPEVEAAVRAAIAHLASLGAQIRDVSLPDHELLMTGMAGMNAGEWVATHSPWMRTRLHDYSEETQIALLANQFVPASDYATAMRARRLLRERYDAAFKEVDLLVGPTVRVPAPRADELIDDGAPTDGRAKRGVSSASFGRNTRGANRSGCPAITVPCGQADGMPVGLMFVAQTFEEARLLAAAAAYEATTDWHRMRPQCAQ